MRGRSVRDLSASVRQRLMNLARERGEDFQVVLTIYAVERLLYRLSRSVYRDRFILKGAMLLRLWAETPQRPTRDLDLAGRDVHLSERLVETFRELCRIPVEADGLEFDPATVRAEPIAQEQEYQGVRVRVVASLAAARIPLQIDVGFGDVITPEMEESTFPSMLDFPSPRLHAYPPETVIAEKVEAMVRFGIANSRVKDFYDVWLLAQRLRFQGETLARAMAATFRKRRTPLPADTPIALSPEFYEDMQKQTQWRAFVSKDRLDGHQMQLDDAICALRQFLMPPLTAAAKDEALEAVWVPPGPWREV